MTSITVDLKDPRVRRLFFWRHHARPDVVMVWARPVRWDSDTVFAAGDPVDLGVVDVRMARRRFWAGQIALYRVPED